MIRISLIFAFSLSIQAFAKAKFNEFLDRNVGAGTISITLGKSATLRKAVSLNKETKCVTDNVKTLRQTCVLVPFTFEGQDLSQLSKGTQLRINAIHRLGQTHFLPLERVGNGKTHDENKMMSRGYWLRRFIIDSTNGFTQPVSKETLARINRTQPLFLSVGDVVVSSTKDAVDKNSKPEASPKKTKSIEKKSKKASNSLSERGKKSSRSTKGLKGEVRSLRVCFNKIRTSTNWGGPAPLDGLSKLEDFMATHKNKTMRQYYQFCRKNYSFKSSCPGRRQKRKVFSNNDLAVLIDYSMDFPSTRRRFFVLDLKRCQVTFKEYAIHGGRPAGKSSRHDHGSCRSTNGVVKTVEEAPLQPTENTSWAQSFFGGGIGSAPSAPVRHGSRSVRSKFTGQLCRCRNQRGTSKSMTRPQFAVTQGTYLSFKGSKPNPNWGTITYARSRRGRQIVQNGIRLRSLGEPYLGIYRRLLSSGVVFHEDRNIKNRSTVQPVGQGCPAVPRGRLKAMVDRYGSQFTAGTLVYIHAPQCK